MTITIIKDLKGDILTPGHEDYEASLERYLTNVRKRAAIVACPKDEADVLLAMAYAKEYGLDLAVKCGGHNASGASSSEGLVIDLSRHLNSVVIDPESKTAKVGGGCLWLKVEEEALKHGLWPVSGTANATGIGGYTLMGGFGYMTGEQGLAIDNLLAATVVTGTGEICTTSVSLSPDLFWAIRGGGGNFGVVTSFTFRLHNQKQNIWAGKVAFKDDDADAVAAAIRAWWKEADPRSTMDLCVCASTPRLRGYLFFNGTQEEGRHCFEDLLSLDGIVDETGPTTFIEQNSRSFGPITKAYHKSAQHDGYTSGERLQALVQKMMSIGNDPEDGIPSRFRGSTLLAEYRPMAKVAAVDGTATAYHRRNLFNNAFARIQWDEDYRSADGEADGTKTTQHARELARHATSVLQGSGYCNYGSDTTGEDMVVRAFGPNYPRLQRIKARYDPVNTFNKWFPIVPAKAGL